MKQPKWEDRPARLTGFRSGPVRTVVIHDTAGNGTHGDTEYLINAPDPNAPVSVDFTVERDGSIWKLNPDLSKKCCYHAGRATRWLDPVTGEVLKNAQINRASIGIEIVQHRDLKVWKKRGEPVYPSAQVQAVAELCAWLCVTFKLPREAITTHAKIITDGSRTDPREFPFDGEEGFWARFEAALAQGVPQPAVKPTVRDAVDKVPAEQARDEVARAILRFEARYEAFCPHCTAGQPAYSTSDGRWSVGTHSTPNDSRERCHGSGLPVTSGHLAVYKLPASDGGGTYEVAGINDRYHPHEAADLAALVRAGKYEEAETRAASYIRTYTEAATAWSKNMGVEAFLRDCVFNRGARGAARILQRALGVATDGQVGPKTRAALDAFKDHRLLLEKLRAAREWYERAHVGRNEGNPLFKGLVKRWDSAYKLGLKYL